MVRTWCFALRGPGFDVSDWELRSYKLYGAAIRREREGKKKMHQIINLVIYISSWDTTHISSTDKFVHVYEPGSRARTFLAPQKQSLCPPPISIPPKVIACLTYNIRD